MTEFRTFNDSTSKRILDLLQTGYMLYKCKKLQFIHIVNGDGSKTAKIIKRQC